MRRIKGLMPSLKEKKRYMNIEVINLTQQEYIGRPLQELITKINQNLGVFDAAGAGIIPIDFKNNCALIRASAKYQDRIKATLLLINDLGNQKIILKTKKVSGSVNKARTEPRWEVKKWNQYNIK